MRQALAFKQRVDLTAGNPEKRRRRINSQQRLHPRVLRVFWRMCAHKRTVPHRTPSKSVDNAGSAWKDLTRGLHDEDEASIVPLVLAEDECFVEKSRAVSAAEDPLARARLEAKSYAPNKGRHQDFVAQLLLDAAEERWGELRAAERRDLAANRGRRAVWAEPEAFGELDPCRVRTRWPVLQDGARCLARYGAFKCINCEMEFSVSGRYERGAARRPSRRHHCDACKGRLGPLTASQIDAMRKALDAATGESRVRRAAQRTA
jgi:hypothetical protein